MGVDITINLDRMAHVTTHIQREKTMDIERFTEYMALSRKAHDTSLALRESKETRDSIKEVLDARVESDLRAKIAAENALKDFEEGHNG